MKRALAACLLAACALVFAQDTDPQAPLKAQLERIRELRAQRPGDGLLVYYQAMTRVALGEREAAIADLKSLEGRRLGIIPVRQVGFEAVWDDADFQAVRRELADEEPRTANAPVVLRLRDAQLVPEGIAYDARRHRHFLSSIAHHKVVVVDERGKQRDFSAARDGLDAMLGLAVDARRDRLCGVSTNGFEASAEKDRRNAVVCWDLSNGKRVARHDVAEAQQLNDLALAHDGSWYATDTQGGSLYRLAAGASKFERVGAAGALPGANGVAVAPDGTVYVAITSGIARVEPASETIERMAQSDSVVTGGIDGLYWHGGALVGIQNVSNPGRVIRIELGDRGTRVAAMRVLQSHHHPEFDEPTTGTIVRGKLHVIANSYVAHYQPDGTLRDVEHMHGTAIIAVPLRH
jgi:hypothetical protein